MKIKTEKRLKLYELIKYAADNEITNKTYYRNEYDSVHFTGCGNVKMSDAINPGAFFTVEVEEEIFTEDTALKDMKCVGIYKDGVKYKCGEWESPDSLATISGIRDIYDLHTLYKVNADGSLTLLWSAEHGIPSEGVIEI